jgi:hypothetical protein
LALMAFLNRVQCGFGAPDAEAQARAIEALNRRTGLPANLAATAGRSASGCRGGGDA